jgi:hypothetical protein
MGFLDLLEDLGGKSSSAVRMITDWRVLLVAGILAFLAFAIFVLYPIVLFMMRLR